MDIKKELEKFKKEFDAELEKFLDLKIAEAQKISPLARDAVKNFKNYMLGSGKRIRPALMYYTYLTMAGKSFGRNMQAMHGAMAIEFLHTFFIIHDDIADRDDFRRGKLTMHHIYRRLAEKNHNFSDAVHYGNSQALTIGDMAYGFSDEIVSSINFDQAIKKKFLKKLGDIIFITVIGQVSDIWAASEKKNISSRDVMLILKHKTGRYTTEGPIHLGAILAGASGKNLKCLSEYAVPLGIAYQIQDDILGVFGTSAETGKPVGADIREGKKTLLAVKALEFADSAQKKEILKTLGNAKATAKGIERVKKIMVETGSFDYSKKLKEKLVKKSDNALEKSGLDKKSKEFFRQVAGYVIARKN